MNKIYNKVLGFAVLVIALATSTTAKAANEFEASVGADVVNSYIWRGQDLGSAAIQPSLELGWNGLTLGAWGSYGIVDANDVKEFDLTLSYEISGLHIGVTDYWFSTADKYFCYKDGESSHVFEANIGYDFGCVSVDWYTNFAGDDGVNASGKMAYSSYCELNAPFTLGGLEWNASLGFVPYTTSLYGADGFSLTNITITATKEISLSPSFSLPVFAGIATNPDQGKASLVFGLSF